ncbi:MAG: hypothetical protein H0T65_21260 [Deltaproteobacteria bacterium]|nr:hypothetical protein [Deltaproteobacteria bacterium]
MRLILGLCATILLACGGGKTKSGAASGAVAVRAYSATRWIPGSASYAFTARTVREAQQGARDLIDTFGVLAGVTVDEVSAELTSLLLVDPLSTDSLSSIGVDLEGGFALFSESYNPTLVARLASPPAFRAFIERQQNLKLQSVVIGGVEVFSAPLPNQMRISWAVADDWLWIHFSLPDVPDDSATWFSASRKPGDAKWAGDLAFAKGAGEPPVIGFLDVARFLTDAQRRMPALAPCASSLPIANIGKLSLALAGDGKQANARITLDVGSLAPAIASTALPIPEGFAAATAQVPIAAQWNLDLAVVRAKADACMRLFDVNLRELDELGIRAGRGYLRTFDPDDREGTGAVSLDLTHKKYFEKQLDRVPSAMRSALEKKRTFGPYAGKSLSIPMFLTVDYVLTDKLALAGVGDGQLMTMIGKGGTAQGPLFEVALQPQGLSIEAWSELLGLLEIDNAKRIAERLQRWRDARVNLTIDGTRLVFSANGTRR